MAATGHPSGVAGAAVYNRSPFDTVFLCCEQESDEVGLSEHGVGRCCGVVGVLSNEELVFLEPEGVLDSFSTAFAVFARPEEQEEGD